MSEDLVTEKPIFDPETDRKVLRDYIEGVIEKYGTSPAMVHEVLLRLFVEYSIQIYGDNTDEVVGGLIESHGMKLPKDIQTVAA